jgi:hypothetical protein
MAHGVTMLAMARVGVGVGESASTPASSMRALSSAMALRTATCFGQGVGPFTVGYLNDLLKDPSTARRRCAIRSSARRWQRLPPCHALPAAKSIRTDTTRAGGRKSALAG